MLNPGTFHTFFCWFIRTTLRTEYCYVHFANEESGPGGYKQPIRGHRAIKWYTHNVNPSVLLQMPSLRMVSTANIISQLKF